MFKIGFPILYSNRLREPDGTIDKKLYILDLKTLYKFTTQI